MNCFEAIADICKRHGVADLYAFGSRGKEMAAWVRGAAQASVHPESDFDIGVQVDKPQAFGPLARVALTIELEDLFAAARVDLVVLSEADPFLALDVIRGELLYTRDPDRQARHELYILGRAGDLLPFKKQRIRMIMEESAR